MQLVMPSFDVCAPVIESYRPSTVGDLLLAVNFQKPVSGASDLQIVNT